MNALGLIEVIGYPCAIDAADAAAKAASIKVLGISKVGSGIMTVQLSGDVGAINSAVAAGALSASKIGKVLHTHVIPRADSQLLSKGVIKGMEENPLNFKTNSELKGMIVEKGISEEKDLKYMKKDELISLLEKEEPDNA
ncbi:MAG: BMC domain-containing protein [Clostridia bacterium]|nr:BMC domain-containing protein [Clostridia bacterium]